MTNTNNTTNLKAIMDAERFLTDNYITGVFCLFCEEMRKKGIKEKWDHEKRQFAVTEWLKAQPTNPFEDRPADLNVSLTEWYEKIYLPSKWTNNGYRKNNRNKDQQENS